MPQTAPTVVVYWMGGYKKSSGRLQIFSSCEVEKPIAIKLVKQERSPLQW